MAGGRIPGSSYGWILLAGGILFTSACAADRNPSVSTQTLPGGGLWVRNSGPAVWDDEPDSRWRLIEEVRIGRLDGQGPDVFSLVGAIREDGGGRVWIADVESRELRVFDQSGTFLRTVGRRGDGPGEFSRLSSVLVGPEGNIWVDSGSRWEVFDTSGVWLARHALDSNLSGGVRAWTPEGQLLEVGYENLPGGSFMDRRSYYASHSLDPSGTLIAGDTFPTPTIPDYEAVTWRTPDGTGTIINPLPLSHLPGSRLGPDGDLWIADGAGVYAIRRQTLGGDTLLIVEREFESFPVTEADMAGAAEQIKPREGWISSDADPARIPKVYPPFMSYYPATDSTLWVLRQGQEGRLVLDVFDHGGVYQGEVATDVALDRLSIRSVGSNRIYAVAKDDFDVDYVVFLRIDKP